MTEKMTFRTFPTAFKLKAIKRLEAHVAALMRATRFRAGVSRSWRWDEPSLLPTGGGSVQ